MLKIFFKVRLIVMTTFSIPLTLLQAHVPSNESTILNQYNLQKNVSPYCIAVPEGGFVYYFNPKVKPWLEKRLDLQVIQSMRDDLAQALEIPFSKEGFTMASTRRSEEEVDETSYSAIWVRDACWHYFGLRSDDKKGAKKLLLNLMKFYSSPDQIERFINVIDSPEIANPLCNPDAKMDVPLIRFSRKTLSHHEENGVHQRWNHLQFDSHGLFLLAVSDALRSKILSGEEISRENYFMLSLFPAFFKQTEYWQRDDAGPWEEELLNNASTTGLIAAGLREYKNELINHDEIREQLEKAISHAQIDGSLLEKLKDAMSIEEIQKLIQLGVSRVEYNLSLGGEAPDLSGKGLDRRADAALFSLCLPDHSLYFNDPEKIQTILNINLSLVGPYGVFRYRIDPYQAMNYWIDFRAISAIEGSLTPDLSFINRFDKGYMPNNQPFDAQWFFDSMIAGIYYHLASLAEFSIDGRYFLQKGDYHLKRALGQFTGPNAVAANGEILPEMCLPESINTVFTQNFLFKPMPSPICPLGWSTAVMRIALEKAEKAHHKFNDSRFLLKNLKE